MEVPESILTPTYMFMLTDRPDQQGRQRRLVFVGRYGDTRAWEYPLTVDPDTLAVEVMTKCEFRPGANSRFSIHEGNIYWTYNNWVGTDHNNKPRLLGTGFPDFRRREVASDLYEGHCQSHAVLFYDSKVHVVSNDWRVAPAVDQPFRELRGEVPGAHGGTPQILYRSNHYGLILEQESGRLHQVDFVGEKAPDG